MVRRDQSEDSLFHDRLKGEEQGDVLVQLLVQEVDREVLDHPEAGGAEKSGAAVLPPSAWPLRKHPLVPCGAQGRPHVAIAADLLQSVFSSYDGGFMTVG